MNERIRHLRKNELHLTMEKFGEHIGVGKSAISNIESGSRGITEQMIKSICREFHVREEWLRTGDGSVFVDQTNISLDELATQYGATNLELEIMKIYFEFDPETRHSAIKHFMSMLSAAVAADPSLIAPYIDSDNNYNDIPGTPEELESKFPTMNSDDSEAG